MALLITTISSAVAVGFVLFKLYAILLEFVLKKLNWKLAELKSYPETPTLKKVNRLIEACILGYVIWHVYNT